MPSVLTFWVGLAAFWGDVWVATASGFAEAFSAASVAEVSAGAAAFWGGGTFWVVGPMLETDMGQPFWLMSADWTFGPALSDKDGTPSISIGRGMSASTRQSPVVLEPDDHPHHHRPKDTGLVSA